MRSGGVRTRQALCCVPRMRAMLACGVRTRRALCCVPRMRAMLACGVRMRRAPRMRAMRVGSHLHSSSLSGSSAGMEDENGRLIPSASMAEAIVLAVYMPPHAPAPGHACRTCRRTPCHQHTCRRTHPRLQAHATHACPQRCLEELRVAQGAAAMGRGNGEGGHREQRRPRWRGEHVHAQRACMTRGAPGPAAALP
jgi:hypothetical protein